MLAAERWFRLLLRFYPAELRARFGPDMVRAFRDDWRAARRAGGPVAALQVALRTIGDVARTNNLARRERRRPSPATHGAGGSFRPERPAQRGNLMQTLFADIRHGIRSFVHNPGFAIAASVTLAVGVAASVTMFSGLSNFVLDPLPFPEQDRLYRVWSAVPSRGIDDFSPSYLDYLDYREVDEMAALSAWYTTGYNLAEGDAPVRLQVVHASAELFDLLGAEAARGRVFTVAEDELDSPVIVVSHGLWERQFGADPSIVGATVRLDGNPFTVVGVMPENFWFPAPQFDAWAPLDILPSTYDRDARFLGVVGRLADGVTAEQARASLGAVAARLEESFPDTNAGFSDAGLSPLLSEIVFDEMRWSLYILTGTGLLVLLIGCVNVANLLIAKGMSRRRELAVRAALGAGRWRLVRQYLAENLVLGIAGGALGLVGASFAIAGIGAALAANEPGRVPRLQQYLESGLDAQVLVFTMLISVGAVLLFGLVPALHTTGGNLYGGLQDGGRGAASGGGGRRLQKGLVIFELALTLALLVGAGLMLRSHFVVMATDPGMDRSGLLTMSMSLPATQYAEDHQVLGLYRSLLENLDALPATAGATATSALPAGRQSSFRNFEIQGRPVAEASESPFAHRVVVAPNFFEVLRTPLLRGRFLAPTDDENAPPVAVINESLARRYWPDAEPVGEFLRPRGGDPDAPWIEIIGVVADIRNNGLHRPAFSSTYLPLAQMPQRQMNVLVRSSTDPLQLVGAARGAIAELDAALPIFRVMTMDQVFANRFWGETLTMKLLAWCAAGALLLAMVGIYGVISYAVSQRTFEMGVRLAIGARAADVVGLLLRQGLALTSIGVIAGLAMGFGLSRGLSFLLYGVDANDPWTYLSVVVLVVAIATLATWLPARRATRVDPIIALRAD